MKNVSDMYPLSSTQELMLLHAVARPQADTLLNHAVFAIEGNLDRPTFQRAWDEVIRRTPALRTMFLWQDLAEPIQIVREAATMEWTEHDWRALTTVDQTEQLGRLLDDDARRGINLSKAPLMRGALCQVTATNHTFVWTSHHLILDRWCIALVLGDVCRCYEALQAQRPIALPERRPFRDYIAWLKRQDADKTATFWRAQLAGYEPVTSAAAQPAARSAEYPAVIDETVVACLRDVGRRQQLTLGSLLLGAWAVIQGRLVDRDDLVLGVTVAGRPPELMGAEAMIGSFTNVLPLRLALPAEQPVSQWLREIQTRQQAIQQHAHVAMPTIQQWSGLEARGSLIDSLLLFQAPVAPIVSTMTLRPLAGRLNAAYPLTLAAVEDSGRLLLSLVVDAERVSDELAQALLADLGQLLRVLGGASDQPLAVLGQALTAPTVARRQAAERSTARAVTSAERLTRPSEQTTVTLPCNGVEARLLTVWEGVLARRPIGIDVGFFEQGGTSLQAALLIQRVERAFGRRVPLTQLFTTPTIAQMAAALAGDGPLEAWSALVPIQPSGHRPPLFLVHSGAGTCFGYAELARHLDPEQPLFGLQEPGLEPDQAEPTSVEELAQHYVDEIRSVQPHGPYHLGGFCFGGVVAFEMARRLQEAGEEIGTLILLDALRPGPMPVVTARERLERHGRRLARRSPAKRITFVLWRLAQRTRWVVEARSKRLTRELLLRLNRPLTSSLRQAHLLQLNGRLADSYRPAAQPGHAVLIRGTHRDGFFAPDFGWRELLPDGIDVHEVEGNDHLLMLTEPLVNEVARLIQQALEAPAVAASPQPVVTAR